MKNKIILLSFLLINFVFSQSLSTKQGGFVRIGYGAYGMSLGNALSSVDNGYANSLYNPALSSFSVNNKLDLDYTFLSLDRKLNFLSFSKYFEKKQYRNEKDPLRTAISIGLVNSGVSNIEERNDNGDFLRTISTTENLFFLNVSNQFSKKITFGITIKYYYYSLYKDVKADAVGVDLGLLYKFNPNLNFSFSIFDLNSAYRWDTSPIYREYGGNYKEDFPIIKRFGLAYNNKVNDNISYLIACDYDIYDSKSKYLKMGLELSYDDLFFFRTGMDRLDFSNKDDYKYSFGFGIMQNMFNYNVRINYGYIVEPYSLENIHILGINVVL
ncbi:MAG TPA: hypothetical protein PLI27_07395 [Ignavibacteriales bacterium]|nr:hypothetical protein [Ignavibacteriales bacterium]HOL81615.1 hypothetical protein [Ignavibacteriales bacterium]HOM65555.1 hypothetical protein [Ignavibacteriales bacterium]HPD67883.1 hypothetical protein [Ignavibacteriales bacterium]HPP33729.1 hypothetical protein [Ignavibacteriales bacterium]